MPSKTELRKFRRKWRKYRPLPRLFHPVELNVSPGEQFLNEMYKSLNSWSQSELNGLLGPNDYTNILDKTEAAKDMVSEVFDGYSLDTLHYFIGDL